MSEEIVENRETMLGQRQSPLVDVIQIKPGARSLALAVCVRVRKRDRDREPQGTTEAVTVHHVRFLKCPLQKLNGIVTPPPRALFQKKC